MKLGQICREITKKVFVPGVYVVALKKMGWHKNHSVEKGEQYIIDGWRGGWLRLNRLDGTAIDDGFVESQFRKVV